LANFVANLSFLKTRRIYLSINDLLQVNPRQLWLKIAADARLTQQIGQVRRQKAMRKRRFIWRG